MPLDHTRFKRRLPGDNLPPTSSVVDVVSARAALPKDRTTKGRTVAGKVTQIQMHAVTGSGQLTADLQGHSLLEELLEEVRVIRSYLEGSAESTGEKHDAAK